MSFLKYQKQNPDILNNYLKYKAYIEFLAKTTIDETYFDLRTLFRYIKLYLYDKNKTSSITPQEFKTITISDITINDLSQVNEKVIESYIKFLSDILNNDVKARNRKLTSAKKFFEYLEVNNIINTNPTKNINSGKVGRRLPKYLNLKESKQLLANTINSDCKFKIRNYAIICIFLNCCIRLSELTSINLSDLKIDDSEQTLKIHGKGNKERIVYLNEAVCEAIISYLKIRPDLSKSNKDYNALFISRTI